MKALLAILCFFAVFGNGSAVHSKDGPPAEEKNESGKASSAKRDALRERYTSAQIEYQKRFYEIMVNKHPELKPVLEINRDLQTAFIQSQTAKFYYLLRHDPGKIKRTEGISAWANFDWTESEALLKSNREFAQLEKDIEKLKKLNNGHPQWPQAREKFRNIMQDKDHKAALDKLNKERSEIDKILRKAP